MGKNSNFEANSFEVNFDGLIGPTHNYSGLSFGNVASSSNAKKLSSPKKAALQGLKKMKFLMDLGFKQGIIPPQRRPLTSVLRAWGFLGSRAEIIQKAYRENPVLLSLCYSASSMWTANAATVIPSIDSSDQKVHFIPANLRTNAHRSLEPNQTSRVFKEIFSNSKFFNHHAPLPGGRAFEDEGAANHTRFSASHSTKGVHLFVFGRVALDRTFSEPKKFPARQTREASQAVARLGCLSDENTILIQQKTSVIDEGVFHNDVISVGNENVFLCHEEAFENTSMLIEKLKQKIGNEFTPVLVAKNDISVMDAVKSYLFNSQLLTLPGSNLGAPNKMILVAPKECQENERVKKWIDQKLVAGKNPVQEVYYLDVRESMRNGGGPACLRLRVLLSEEELHAVHPSCLFSEDLYQELTGWVEKHYRDELAPADLADPKLAIEVDAAFDELSEILQLESLKEDQN